MKNFPCLWCASPSSVLRTFAIAWLILALGVAAHAQAPAITVHPITQGVLPGGTLTLGVTATGAGPLTYQWTRNGVPLAGATTASFTIRGAQVRDAARYNVTVSNAMGATTSAPAQVNLIGQLWALGSDAAGRLGIGSRSTRETPLPIASGVTAMTTGTSHSLYLKNDGTLWAMGSNARGQFGDGTTTSRDLAVPVAVGVKAIAAGSRHSLYITNDGTLWAMGDNSFGQLGDGATFDPNVFPDLQSNSPLKVATGVKAVAAGSNHSLFIKTDGTLWATGNNQWGQLGDGGPPANSRTRPQRSVPVQVATDVSGVAGGSTHSVYVKTDGTLWTMGITAQGILGGGATTLQRNSPVQVTTGVSDVAAGVGRALFVKTDGSVWEFYCCVDEGRTALPARVAVGVAVVAASGAHTLWVKPDGTLWAMGNNSSGQLGDGTNTSRAEAVKVATAVTTVAAAEGHSLFLTDDGTLWGMGNAASGQLGYPMTTSRTSPVQVATEVSAVAAGQEHTMFLKSDATLWAMGLNSDSQLGDGTTATRSSPVQVAVGVSAMAVAGRFSMYLKTDGTLWTIGSNFNGQLGDGTTTAPNSEVYAPPRTFPAQVASGVSAIASGGAHNLFLKTDGTLWGMGILFWGVPGQGGAVTQRNSPVQLATGVNAVAAGNMHTLFLKNDGTLWAMGANDRGQLGDGTTTPRESPVQIASAVSAVAAGILHSVYLKTDGTVWTNGENGAGQLGDGTTTQRNLPAQVAAGVIAIAAGSTNTMYQKSDGTIWGMGSNFSGQLGDGTVMNRNSAVQIAHGALTMTVGGSSSYFIYPAGAGAVPSVSAQPVGGSYAPGASVTLTVAATGAELIDYRWRKNGIEIPGARSATLVVSYLQSNDAGGYDVLISSTAGSVTSASATLKVELSRLVNLSLLTSLTAPGESFTLGYVVGGTGTNGPKPLVIRAAGPSLAALGVSDTLDDPKIQLFAGPMKTGENDNWGGSATLADAMLATGAFAYTGPASRDAAAAVLLTTRDNSVNVSAAGSGTGMVIAEIYDATTAARFNVTTPRLVNVSVLKSLGAGITVGFVVGGNGTRNVLLRAIGPTLATGFGITGATANPELTLYSGQTILASNATWGGGAMLSAAFASAGAFTLPPASRDAAIVAELIPGNYTVQVSPVGSATGTILVEIYELP